MGNNKNWKLYPNLWGFIVGEPGTKKSPAMTNALFALKELSDKANKEFVCNQAANKDKIEDLKAEEAWIKKLLSNKNPGKGKAPKSKEDSDNPEQAKEKNKESLAQIRSEINSLDVKCKRYIVNNSSIEKLHELLNENPNGLLIFFDELSGFFYKIISSDDGQEKAFYLQGWNGGDSFTIDRIMRGSVYVPKLTITILGGIQPAALKKAINLQKSNRYNEDSEIIDDGLLARFQLAIYPENIAVTEYIDEYVDDSIYESIREIFRFIESVVPEDILFDDFLCDFEDDAFELWKEVYLKNQNKEINAEYTVKTLLKSHLNKFPKLIVSLAFIFHISDCIYFKKTSHDNLTQISRNSLEKAVKFSEFLWQHAIKIYSIFEDNKHQTADLLYQKILNGKVKDADNIRSISKKHWSGLTDVKKIEEAICLLSEYNIAKIEEVKTVGRSSYAIRVNPKLNVPTEKTSPKSDKSYNEEF